MTVAGGIVALLHWNVHRINDIELKREATVAAGVSPQSAKASGPGSSGPVASGAGAAKAPVAKVPKKQATFSESMATLGKLSNYLQQHSNTFR